jgi:hypothetical protein
MYRYSRTGTNLKKCLHLKICPTFYILKVFDLRLPVQKKCV